MSERFSVDTDDRLTTVDVIDRVAATVPDGNADSRLRATLLGPDVSVPVADGDLELGTWQSIYCRL